MLLIKVTSRKTSGPDRASFWPAAERILVHRDAKTMHILPAA